MNAPLYTWPADARDGSKTRRREARRDIRRILGTSSDDAPNLLQCLDAARELARLIDLASNGRYGLGVVRPTFEGETGQAAYHEHYTFGPQAGVIFTEATLESSSQVHEPTTTTGRRERELQRRLRERAGA